jgi:hypothetical protein
MSEKDERPRTSEEDEPCEEDASGPRTWATPPDPLRSDPVAGGPEDEDSGLGGTVEEPTPTPERTASKRAAAPVRAAPTDTTPASGYQKSLIYSGIIGIVLAAIGITMVGLRRRSW